MKPSPTFLHEEIFGFFELDDHGIVKYSRTGVLPDRSQDRSIIGKNYFESVQFKNGEDLRRIFRRFVESREAADSFPFDVCVDNSVIHTKITLTRAFETEVFPPENIVMLSIREISQ